MTLATYSNPNLGPDGGASPATAVRELHRGSRARPHNQQSTITTLLNSRGKRHAAARHVVVRVLFLVGVLHRRSLAAARGARQARLPRGILCRRGRRARIEARPVLSRLGSRGASSRGASSGRGCCSSGQRCMLDLRKDGHPALTVRLHDPLEELLLGREALLVAEAGPLLHTEDEAGARIVVLLAQEVACNNGQAVVGGEILELCTFYA